MTVRSICLHYITSMNLRYRPHLHRWEENVIKITQNKHAIILTLRSFMHNFSNGAHSGLYLVTVATINVSEIGERLNLFISRKQVYLISLMQTGYFWRIKLVMFAAFDITIHYKCLFAPRFDARIALNTHQRATGLYTKSVHHNYDSYLKWWRPVTWVGDEAKMLLA